jgi:hypothetical protein
LSLFGFTLANWQELKKSLLDYPINHPAVNKTSFLYGEMYEINCSIVSLDGRNPCVRSFWAIEPPNPNPKFITAYAGPQSADERAGDSVPHLRLRYHNTAYETP